MSAATLRISSGSFASDCPCLKLLQASPSSLAGIHVVAVGADHRADRKPAPGVRLRAGMAAVHEALGSARTKISLALDISFNLLANFRAFEKTLEQSL